MALRGPNRLRYRFLVKALDLDVFRAPCQRNVQGFLYIGERTSLQVGNEQDDDRLAWKSSIGFLHFDREWDMPWAFARLLALFCHKRVLRKMRYIREGWFVDVYQGMLTGIVIAEREILSANECVRLPDWLPDAENATDWLTDRLLVRFQATRSIVAPPDFSRPIRDELREYAKSH